MSDLPEIAGIVSQPTGNQAAPAAGASTSFAPATDPKVLLNQAIEQIEAVIMRTTTNPQARTREIQAIKEAYQQASIKFDQNGNQQ